MIAIGCSWYLLLFTYFLLLMLRASERGKICSFLGIRCNGFLLCHQFRLAQQSKSREIIISKLSTCKCAQIFIYTTHYTACAILYG